VADTKQSDLGDLTEATVALGDFIPLRDVSDLAFAATGTNKEITIQDLADFLKTGIGLPRVAHLGTQHSISSTTGTEVTDLTMALEVGTYVFNYWLIEQSATVTVAPKFAINFDGTASKANWWFQYADLSATLLAAIGTVAHDVSTSTLGFQMAQAEDDFATATGNLHPQATTNAVQTINTNMLVAIKGIIVVTGAGNLELWHNSETATATSLEVGSSLVVVRTA
jgi:hypothetical protein